MSHSGCSAADVWTADGGLEESLLVILGWLSGHHLVLVNGELHLLHLMIATDLSMQPLIADLRRCSVNNFLELRHVSILEIVRGELRIDSLSSYRSAGLMAILGCVHSLVFWLRLFTKLWNSPHDFLVYKVAHYLNRFLFRGVDIH